MFHHEFYNAQLAHEQIVFEIRVILSEMKTRFGILHFHLGAELVIEFHGRTLTGQILFHNLKRVAMLHALPQSHYPHIFTHCLLTVHVDDGLVGLSFRALSDLHYHSLV